MDQAKFVDKMQSVQDLFGHFLKTRHVEIVLFLNLTVVLGVLVEVVSQELGHDEKMLLVIEVINHFQQVFGIEIITVGTDKSKELDLVYTLIKIVFVVLNDFHADHLLSVNIIALNGF